MAWNSSEEKTDEEKDNYIQLTPKEAIFLNNSEKIPIRYMS
jgi:hypothetical protein